MLNGYPVIRFTAASRNTSWTIDHWFWLRWTNSGPLLSSICSIRVAEFCAIPCPEFICAVGLISNVWDFDVLGNTYDTGAKYTTDNLSVNCCISFIVNQNVGKGFNRDLVVNFHEQRFLLVEYSLCHYTNRSSSCRTSKEKPCIERYDWYWFCVYLFEKHSVTTVYHLRFCVFLA